MSTYEATRYAYSSKRRIVWEEICRLLNNGRIAATDRVLELGCGYGDFIGNIKASSKTAIELAPTSSESALQYGNIDLMVGDAATIMPTLADNSFDAVFCSNYFEHFTHDDISSQLREVSRILEPGGRLIVVQPNYRLCVRNYFDDYTHKSIFSDTSFGDFLSVHGFTLLERKPRFLPFSFKSKMPISRLLVRGYLNSPFKPLAAQFLMIAVNSKK